MSKRLSEIFNFLARSEPATTPRKLWISANQESNHATSITGYQASVMEQCPGANHLVAPTCRIRAASGSQMTRKVH